MSSPQFRNASFWTRREFLGAAGGAALALGCSRQKPASTAGRLVDNVIVLGVDGMDPHLVQTYVDQGLMPNCKKLLEAGSFQPLRTSDPPQSPVAWSNFISGTNPGGHGIFDFIGRDPNTYLPFHSTSKVSGGGQPLKIGSWEIPLSPGTIQNLRHGPTFWNELEQHGIDCTVLRMPANFPPTETEAVTLSGMGTPDLQGTYGIFTLYTDDPKQRTRSVPGGQIRKVFVKDHVVECKLEGPTNPFSSAKEKERLEVPFQVYIDPERPLAKIVIGDTSAVLREGEWSEWLVVKFPMLPYVVEASGICRFLLKQVQGGFGLYMSPVNIDPANPALPISTPPDYSQRLVRELGYFYTQGIVEDASALRAGVLDANQYRQQSTFVLDERMRFFEHEFARFNSGFFFYYFSSLDQNSHVFWRALDPKHPLYSPTLAKEQGDFIPSLYAQIDRAIGLAMQRIDDRTILLVMSDHGFTSFRRQFNLNSWLLDNGFIRSRNPRTRLRSLFEADWANTKAYGIGINSLYLNLKGRERDGNVLPGTAADALTRRLIRQLKEAKDPDTGEQVISNVFRAKDIYQGPYAEQAPDLIVAYNNFYRASWDTILGSDFPVQHVSDNTDAWSGDHCVDSQFVPGVLISNRKLTIPKPELADLAPSILAQFGVPIPSVMTGRNIF